MSFEDLGCLITSVCLKPVQLPSSDCSSLTRAFALPWGGSYQRKGKQISFFSS